MRSAGEVRHLSRDGSRRTSPGKRAGLTPTYGLIRIWTIVFGALIGMVAVGCAAVAPLDDAVLIDVTLASTSDMARYEEARESRSRETFRGATINDARGRSHFSAAEYDKYRAYLRENPLHLPVFDQAFKWPNVRLSFQSRRALFDPDASVMPRVAFHMCGSYGDEQPLWGFGSPEVIWRGRFVTAERAREIEKLLAADARAQEYEVFFQYVHYAEEKQTREPVSSVTLLPLPDDLCVALISYNFLSPPSVGRPSRVSKGAINDAVGPLPRPLRSANQTSN